MKLLLPLAIALFGQGKVNQAARTLWQALRLVEVEGYIRPFLEQGIDMVTLLTLVGKQELLWFVGQGLSNREIAQRLTITVNTVKSHLRRIYLKLEVQNRAQAVIRAKEIGCGPSRTSENS